ncbi:MAG: hypothetical protein V4549_03770 [Bacteroidota bacterium]
MRKATAIFLLLLFLIANSGVAISAHWCGGKLSSIDFFADREHKCKCGKKAMKPNCCKDKTLQLKANDELSKTNHFAFKISITKFLFPLARQIELVPPTQLQYVASNFYHPPPFNPKAPIYLLDRSFLI